MDKLLVWISVQFLTRVTSSDSVVGVQIQQFENLLNAEIRNGQFCCCDGLPCVNDINTLSACEAKCDTYLRIYFPPCPPKETCAHTMPTNVITNEPFVNGGRTILLIPSGESNMESQNPVTIEAWEIDTGDGATDDEIDSFTIPMAETVTNFSQPIVIAGNNGLGLLTVSYHNITAGTTLKNSVDHSTCSQAQKSTCASLVCQTSSTSSSCSCSDSKKWITTPQATMTETVVAKATCTMTTADTMLIADSTTWILAIVFFIIAVVAVIIIAVLGIVLHGMKKSTKLENNSKLTLAQPEPSCTENDAYNIVDFEHKGHFGGKTAAGNSKMEMDYDEQKEYI